MIQRAVSNCVTRAFFMQSVTQTKLTHLKLTSVWLSTPVASTWTVMSHTEGTFSCENKTWDYVRATCTCNMTARSCCWPHADDTHYIMCSQLQHTRWEVAGNSDLFHETINGSSAHVHEEHLRKQDEGRGRLIVLLPCLGYLRQWPATMRLKTFRVQVLVMWHHWLSAQTGAQPSTALLS